MNPTSIAAVTALLIALALPTRARPDSFSRMPDPRGEFIRLCAPYMVKRSEHPEAVCDCLHRQAVAMVDDVEVRDALLYGISETGVPTIDKAWLPPAKEEQIDRTLTRIAAPTMACIYGK